jgi:hypothetical protein
LLVFEAMRSWRAAFRSAADEARVSDITAGCPNRQ